MPYAILFPGQGSQTVGMGADVIEKRTDLLGDVADEVLGWSLRDLVLTGPEEALTATDRAQPALYAVAYALWDELAKVTPQPAAAAGHSLGEYTALAASGSFEFTAGLRLVAARGAAMAVAAEQKRGGMAALLGSDPESAGTIAEARRADGGSLWVANLNSPGQVVVAGGRADIAWLVENARDLGVRRAVELDVSGAFHSPLMEPAVAELAAALQETPTAPPSFPVYSNADAQPVRDVADILVRQLTNPVRFEETLRNMAAAGIDTFVHIGPGEVTAGLVRRTVDDASVYVVNSLQSIDEVAGAVS